MQSFNALANKACNSMLFMSVIGLIIPTAAVQLSGNGSGDSDQTWVRGPRGPLPRAEPAASWHIPAQQRACAGGSCSGLARPLLGAPGSDPASCSRHCLQVLEVSRGTAVVLLACYICYLSFQLFTHHDMFSEVEHELGERRPTQLGVWAAGCRLLLVRAQGLSSGF
jgi:Ca2+/H+ antiporter